MDATTHKSQPNTGPLARLIRFCLENKLVVALFVMTYFVLPNFFTFFESLKMELPWQTQLLMSISHLI